MTEKLCPVDKSPCVRERCAIYNEELRMCSWAIIKVARSEQETIHETGGAREPKQKKPQAEKPSKYKVHLFD